MKHSSVVFLSSFGVLLLSMAHHTQAESAIWGANPNTASWTESANWMPNAIPNGAADIATFGVSSVTNVSAPAPGDAVLEVDSIVFNANASAYTIAFFGPPNYTQFLLLVARAS